MPKAAISDLELKLWRDRLYFADQVWKEKGLLGDETGTECNESLFRLFSYYRGVHWDYDWGFLDDAERATVNSVFETANTMMAQIAARAPRVQLFPESPQAVAGVRPAQELLNYYVKELDMKRPASRATHEALFSALGGVIRHGYTPTDDFFDKEGNRIHSDRGMKPDTPWIQHVHSWDFRADCTKSSFHPAEADWCAFRALMTVDQIKDTDGMRVPNNLTPTISISADKLKPRELKSLQNEDFTSMVEVWSIYDSREQKWLQWSPGAPDDLVRNPADWPLPWDELPYDLLAFNPIAGDPFQQPYMAEVAPIHRERNRIRTMMSRLSRDLRRLVGVNIGMLDDSQHSRLFDGIGPDLLEFVKLKGPASEAIANIQIGGFPQELLLYDRQLEEDIRQITGQSRMDRAQRINVESAQEAFQVQSGSDTQRGRNQAAHEDFWKGIIRKFGQGLRAVMDEERIVPIIGVEDAETLAQLQQSGEPFLRVTPDVIQQDYLYEIAVGSTLPRSQAEEQRKAIAWLEIAKQFPQNANIQNALIDVARSLDKDPSRALIDEETRQLQNAQTEEQGGDAGNVPPGLSPVIAMPGGGA